MTTVAPTRPVVLGEVRHGLVDPRGGCRDLDAVLDAARAAERDGASAVVVPAPDADAPAERHWPSTAQALAVLLATERVRVVVGVHAGAWRPEALARFAAGADALSGGRLVVQLLGAASGPFAEALRARWDGEIVVGDAGLAAVA
jgi:Luciferase-like monooxygenase